MKIKNILIWSGIFILIILFIFFIKTPKINEKYLENFTTENPFEIIGEGSLLAQQGEQSEVEDYFEPYDNFSYIQELHWGKMPIGYYIENPEVCGIKVVNQTRDAFKIIQNLTEEIISFEEKSSDEENTILIECFHRYGENVDIEFRSGSTYAYAQITYIFDDEKENVIYNGEIKLYRITPGSYYGRCKAKPVTIMHEILHLFGFEDNSKTDSIMYRYIGNCADIDEDIIKELKEKYTSP